MTPSFAGVLSSLAAAGDLAAAFVGLEAAPAAGADGAGESAPIGEVATAVPATPAGLAAVALAAGLDV